MKFNLLVTTLAFMVCTAFSHADPFPNKPIRLVVPYPPGGGTDVVARLIAEPLTQALNQSVYIDNKGGANGIIGCNFVANAQADGYTILLVLPSQMSVNPALYKKASYDPIQDFAPIIQLTSFEVALVIYPSLEVNSVTELIQYAKSKPGSLSLASAGTGSSGHMAAVWFAMKTGIDWVHIPFKGAGPAFADLLAGSEQVMFATTLSTLPYVRSGKLKALGVTGATRSAAAPEIPAIAESVPGYEFTQWHGLVAPAKTPAEVIAKLNNEIAKILKTPKMRERFASLGSEVVAGSPQDFDKLIKNELTRYADIVKITGMKAE
jgi:tripartite-type tricarboxylate transporter receptor subunit TctC